jgi:uncharacterized membrane protein
MKKIKLYWLIPFSYFFILMLLITIKYFPFNSTSAFLQIKQREVNSISVYLYIFYIHVFSAILTLLAGFTQFNNYILTNHKKIHRKVGKIYVLIILFFAAPSGFFIGLFANGGLISKISFIILSILWFFFTLKAFLFIKDKNIENHKKFMYRSFALTISAITLRFWKVILVYLFHPAPMDVYQIISWLGWIPNLLIAEYIIYEKFNFKKRFF